VEAVPVTSITAESVAKAFITGWVSRFGTPLELVTDRGQQFESALFRQLSRSLGFHRIRTTAFHPQSNGLLERFHRTLKAALRSKVIGGAVWTEALPLVLLALRITPQANDCSAFEMVTGATPLLPQCGVAPSVDHLTSGYVQRLARILQQQFVDPRSTTQQFSEDSIPAELSNCDRVWLRIDRIRRPLEAPYAGPYTVVRRLGKVFILRKLDGSEVSVSVDRLKPFRHSRLESHNHSSGSSIRKTVRFAC
jgi:hypothetical protein